MAADGVERSAFAEELAREAGQVAQSYLARGHLEVRSKGVLDWVTDADVEIERLIRRRIAAAFPDDRVLGEEEGNGTVAPQTVAATWVVDPIDGTTCFVSGLPSWCVSIACVDQAGSPWLGVVHDPSGAETFSAMRGMGLTVNGEPVHVPTMRVTDGLVGVGHPRGAPDEPTLLFLKNLFAAGGLFYNSGSAALSLAYVAAGRLAGFFESELRAWDALAGEILVTESGGWSTAFMRDGSLTTAKPVLAANRGSASTLWEMAGEMVDGIGRPDPVDGGRRQ